jgi:hypothetical protein
MELQPKEIKGVGFEKNNNFKLHRRGNPSKQARIRIHLPPSTHAHFVVRSSFRDANATTPSLVPVSRTGSVGLT